MSWQDVVIGLGQFVFTVALVPALLSRASKPPAVTSLATGAILYAFAIAYASLGMWLAVSSVSICGAAWFWLAYQKLRL